MNFLLALVAFILAFPAHAGMFCEKYPASCAVAPAQVAVQAPAPVAAPATTTTVHVKARRAAADMPQRADILTCTVGTRELNDGKNPLHRYPAEVHEAGIVQFIDEFCLRTGPGGNAQAIAAEQRDAEELYQAWLGYQCRGDGVPKWANPDCVTPVRVGTPPTNANPDLGGNAGSVGNGDVDWLDRGWRLGFGLGGAMLHTDGHSGINVNSTTGLVTGSVEAKYNFAGKRTGLGVRGSYGYDVKGGGLYSGHIVPNIYVDDASRVRIEPFAGYSFQVERGYDEDRIDFGLGVAYRTAPKWELLGTIVYGYDLDTVNTPDHGVALGLQFRFVPGLSGISSR